MYNAAVSVNSTYDCSGTGAASEVNDIVNALKNTFGYASTAKKANYDYQTALNELKSSRPVIMTGYTTQTGWILHSYSGDIAGSLTAIRNLPFAEICISFFI